MKYALYYEGQGDLYWDYIETDSLDTIDCLMKLRLGQTSPFAAYVLNKYGGVIVTNIYPRDIRQWWAEEES